MSYLGDTTITISTKDMVAIAEGLTGLGVKPDSTVDIPSTSGGTNWLVWGGVAIAAFFILRK